VEAVAVFIGKHRYKKGVVMKKLSCLFLYAWIMLAVGFSLFASNDGDGSGQAGQVAKKAKCPRKVAVMIETIKPELFREYQYFTAQAQAETIAVNSSVAGVISEIKVSEGSLVEAEQELAVLNAGLNMEIKNLEAEAARKKKILTDRKNWKVKSTKAIQAAEQEYQKIYSLLMQKRSQTAQLVKATGPGMVHSLKVKVGDEITAGTVLMELLDMRYMSATIPLNAADNGLFKVGEKISGHIIGKEELSAEIVTVEAERLTLRLDNSKNLVNSGDSFTIKKLIAEHVDALVVPSTAIAKDSLGDYVYVAEKNKAKKSYVSSGASADGRTMILKGLTTQTQLVVSGFECLVGSNKVRIINQEQSAAEKAATEAKLQKKQAETAAKEEAKARKEKEKLEKQAAKKAKKEAAATTKADEVKGEAVHGAQKAECPKRVTVQADAIKPETFLEYRYHSAPTFPEMMAITSSAAGQVVTVKVSEGSLVEKGQELVLVTVGLNEEIIKLQQEAARKKKIWTARQNSAAASEKTVQAAERDYLKTLSLLEQKTAQYAQAILAPVAGTVQNLKVAAGDEILNSAVLLEIMTEDHLLVKIPLSMADGGGEQVSGRIAGLDAELTAQNIGSSDQQLTLRLDNTGHAIKAGSIFTVRKLKTEHANAVVVTSAALLKDSLGDYVYIVKKKKAKKTYVGVGPREAGKTLILQGLTPEMALILSGFECLEDGKKISVVTPDELARERARAMGMEQPAAEEKVSRSLFGNKLKIGAYGTYYLMLGKNFKEVYAGLAGFGGELSFRFNKKIDIWVSGGMANKNAIFSGSNEAMQFKMIPLAAAARYYLMDKGKWSAFVGAGPNVFLVKDFNPAGDIKTTFIVFNVLAGGYVKLTSKLYGLLLAKFNLVKKDLFPESDTDDPLDLTGLGFNIGLAFSL